MYSYQLLGEFELRDVRGKRRSLSTRKAEWLLAYLVLYPESHSRERLAGLFWPDSEEAKADSSLRQALHAIRKVLEPTASRQGTYLVIERGMVQLNAHSACSDTAEFEKLLKASVTLTAPEKAQTLQKAIALYHGDLLEGCYEDWCTEPRDYLRELYLKALQELIACLRETKDYAAAIHYAKQYLIKTPLQEEIHRQLMFLYHAKGERNAALQQYRECERILKTELGVEPLPETRALYREIEERANPDRLEERAFHARELIRHYPELGAPFVGRETEWVQCVSAWDEVKLGRGRLIFLEGEAGVGKTRLAQEFLGYLIQERAQLLSGRCYEIEGKLPYQPLIEALRQGLAPCSSELLQEFSPLWLGEIVKLLPELSEKVPQLRPSTELQSREQERNRLFEALSQFLVWLAQQRPLALFLDDLQWADESSLQFLAYLARRLPDKAIFVLGTYRVEEVNQEHLLWGIVQQLTRDQLVLSLTLAPLPAAETEKLVQAMLKTEELVELGQMIYAQSKGLPFFAIELVKALIEIGTLSLDREGNWRLERAHWMADYVPSNARALVETQLRRLSRLSRQFLEIASIIGRGFTSELLAHLLGRGTPEVFDQIEELLRAHLIVAEPEQYHFRHDLIRQVVYSALVPERRQHWHRAIGEWLERTHAPELDKISGELAFHFVQAARWEKALEYSLRAGETAKRAYANQEAIEHFEQALELAQRLENTEAIREAYVNLGHVCVYSGKLDEGIEYCRNALELTSDVHARARNYETMATGYNYKREHEKALVWCCEQAIKELGEDDASLEMAKICDFAASMLCQLRRNRDAIQYCKRSLRILEQTEEHSVTARVFTRLGITHRNQEDFDRAIEFHLRAVKSAEKANDLLEMASTYYETGFTYCGKGDAFLAVQFLSRALSLCAQAGHITLTIWIYQLLSLAHIQSPNLETAAACIRKSLELAIHHSKTREIATAHSFLGCIAMANTRKKEAEEHFVIAIEKAGSTNGSLYVEVASILALLKRFTDALDWLNQGLPHMTSVQLANAKSSPYLKCLRNHPRFKQLFGDNSTSR